MSQDMEKVTNDHATHSLDDYLYGAGCGNHWIYIDDDLHVKGVRLMTMRLFSECLNCMETNCNICPIYTEAALQGESIVKKEDMVNSPSHYKTFPDAEAIDLIRKVLTPEEFDGYCKGNFLKYRLRAGDKDDLTQDISKSNVYRGWINGWTES